MRGKVFAGFALFLLMVFVLSAKEIRVGALLPLSGAASSLGKQSRLALEVAEGEINDYLASIKSDWRVKVLVEDTRSEPNTALEKLRKLAKEGVRFVVGPMTSGEVAAAKSFADKNGIILISQSSTAPDLSVPNDNVFRLVPDDKHQAEVIARLMVKDELKVVVPVWRNDIWGKNLSAATKDWFEKLGGRVLDGISYDPGAKDFSSVLGSLEATVSDAVKKYGADAVGVYLISLNEAAKIFEQAGKFDALSGVKWYGSDGTALNNELIKNASAAQFAQKVRFINPLYSGDVTEERLRVGELLKGKLGREPDTYAFVAYDALWLVVLTELVTGGTDEPGALRRAFTRTANSYYGITGWTGLNDAGDRDFGDYNFWTISTDGGSPKWECTAKFLADPAMEGVVIYLK